MANERRVPQSRLGRLAHLGRLAGGIAGGMLSEGARQLGRGQRPSFGDLLLTPDNARRLTERLSEMRGAAMKVGQLLSMESGEYLPPELSQVLARLREQAHYMPLGQVAKVLEGAWGEGWDKDFRRFSFTPLAAASIGQVHQAELRDGTALAVKVQYPGIRDSIDSDVDNVAMLLRLVNAVPKGLDLAPLLAEAKQQLHVEADYQQEASFLRRFAGHLAGDARFELPEVRESHTSAEVLSMGFLAGAPIEALADADQPIRDQSAAALLDLALREVLQWGLIQTDPNFANYRFDARRQKLQLLDFGASREYPLERRHAFAQLMRAAIEGDDQDLVDAAIEVGYLAAGDPPAYRDGILSLLRAVVEPVRSRRDYDFGRSDLARRIGDTVLELRLRERFTRMPPPDVLFLHRKLGGLYLLFSRLGACIPVREQVLSALAMPHAPEHGNKPATVDEG
jgi:predicted unusual protein kinase regulating ubiquinone biosynthesis (AarF/ABC1/UbiB family)